MPKKNGREVYVEAVKIKPDVKVIFMSGYTANVIHKDGMLEEGLNFISKPVSPSELLKKVREALDGWLPADLVIMFSGILLMNRNYSGKTKTKKDFYRKGACLRAYTHRQAKNAKETKIFMGSEDKNLHDLRAFAVPSLWVASHSLATMRLM